ncbi:hypothetical protein [Cupriavidus sp. 8B]
MFDLFLATRMVVDYFWEFKELSVAHLLVFLFIWAEAALKGKPAHWKSTREDAILIIFSFVLLSSYLRGVSEENTILLAKQISFVLSFWAGRILYVGDQTLKRSNALSIVGIVGLTAASMLGIGYQDWGYVNTFTGGYYYKTDLTLSAAIALAFVLVYTKSRILKLAMLAMAGWIVLRANSRVFIPVLMLMPLLQTFYLGRKPGAKRSFLRVALIGLIACFGTYVFFTTIMQFTPLSGYLGFDIADGFSAKNSQGRADIWQALWDGYCNASLDQQIFGAGLDADQRFTAEFSEEFFGGKNSHSSPLYLLTCTGAIGLALHIWVVFIIIKRAARGLQQNIDNRIEQLFFMLAMIYIISGITTEAVIRPQMMIPFWFLAGAVVRRSQMQTSIIGQYGTQHLSTAIWEGRLYRRPPRGTGLESR